MSASIYFKNAVRSIAIDGDVNMCNRNARIFVTALGLNPEFEELSVPVTEFRTALEQFLSSEIASVIDNGRPAEVFKGQAGCIEIQAGLRPGYLADKVQAALQLTIEAQDKGATHVYFA